MSASDDLSGANVSTERTQSTILEEIKALSGEIRTKTEALMQEGGRTYEAQAEIQRLKRARETVRSELMPFKLVWSHPDPESLPTPVRMTRDELRQFMGFCGPWEQEELNYAR